MPIFKNPNIFSQNFNKKTPFRNEEIEEEASTDWWETSPGVDKTDLTKGEKKIRKKTNPDRIEKKEQRKTKRKETWGKVKSKADEIGMELLNRPTQSDPYL